MPFTDSLSAQLSADENRILLPLSHFSWQHSGITQTDNHERSLHRLFRLIVFLPFVALYYRSSTIA